MTAVLCTFDVEGVPVQQGSKHLLPTARGPRLVEEQDRGARRGRLKRWRATVAWSARAAYHGAPAAGALELEATFRLPRPRTVTRARPAVKPDLSKLVRALEDAMTGIVWGDDAQVVRYGSVEKVYADEHQGPGVRVVVRRAREP